MAKVLSSSNGMIMSTKNNTPPKGKPNIGPGSTVGSRSGSVKPTGAKVAPEYNFNPGTMTNKTPGTSKNTSVTGRKMGGLPKAGGAMAKFG